MRSRLRSRWVLVAVAALAMGASGTYQFVWSSIRPALATQVSASETDLGTVFTVYVIAQTLSQFPAGRFRDRHGPRVPAAVGALLVAAGYAGIGLAATTWQAYLAYGVGGVGAGVVYTVAVNTPVKWFTERRGLATGVVTMAYSGLSVLFIPYVRGEGSADFTGTMLVVAALAGGAALLGAFVLRDPEVEADGGSETTIEESAAHGWRETVRTWQFWLLYALYAVVNGVGLMLIGKAVAFAEQLGFAGGVATAAASVVALADATGILTIGGASDRLGPERTVAASVTLSGLSVLAGVWVGAAGYGVPFVALLGAAAFFRSPVFSVVPGLVGAYYGRARSSENYALLYTAKVWGGVGGGVASSLLITAAGWNTAFLVGGAALTGVGLLSGFLRPVE